MSVIRPTPSQAALALRSYFARQGLELALCSAKEAVAVTRGHASWTSLIAATAAETGQPDEPTWCHHCEELLEHATGYCTDPSCPYHHWRQDVPYGRLVLQSTAEVEARHGRRRLMNIPLDRSEFCADVDRIANMLSARELAAEWTDSVDAKRAVGTLSAAAGISEGAVWAAIWEVGPDVVALNRDEADLLPPDSAHR